LSRTAVASAEDASSEACTSAVTRHPIRR
jgi:hypothetical protein